MSYSERLESARNAMREAGADALVVTNLLNVRYLCGFAGSNGLVVVTGDGATFLTDFRYVTASEPIGEFMAVQLADREVVGYLAEHLGELTGGAGRAGFEASHMSVAAHTRLAEANPDVELVATRGLVEDLRAVKEPAELDAIRKSAALLAPVYEAIAGEGLAGRREKEVAWRVRELLYQAGADDLSFDTIVASHERGAMPHADPSDAVIGGGTLVTIDMGCMLDGYASDCTRTFAVGEIPGDLREICDVCLEAQLAAMAAIRPGLDGREADAVARDLIEGAGYGGQFGHGLGHGVGLNVHEEPRLSASSSATLEVGMVVTVEPGIYVPGRGGVRIEDLAIVTADGCERLTMFPKELRTL